MVVEVGAEGQLDAEEFLHADEEFGVFAGRIGTKPFEDLVRDLALPAEFSLDTMNEFIDWSRNVPFQVIRGEGECAV